MRFLVAGLLLPAFTALAEAPPPESWEPDIRAFEARDRLDPPKAGGIVFVGSSSIRLWSTLTTDFPGANAINRGFGGSEITDATHFADRIVIAYRPRQVMLYAGDNDLMNGKMPTQVADAFRAFVEKLRTNLSTVRISFIAIKPSPARAHLLEVARETNGLIRIYARSQRNVDYIDVYTPMLDASGKPHAHLFVEDALHLSAEGYRLWRGIVVPYLVPMPM